MKKTENKETGEVSFSFTGQEIKKLKIGAIAAAVVFAASICIGGYSAYSMTSLRQENTLYRNQLKMAEEKMEALNDKTKAIEKISSQLQDMIKANNNGAGASVQNGGQGGQGGASTVPDKARDVSASDHQSSGTAQETDDGSASVATPGDLLREMRKLDSRLDSQIRTMITLREELMNQTYGMQVQLLNTNATTPDIWPVKGEISSYFGYRSSPGGGIGSTYHEGIDIAGDYGLPIEATASGTITQAGWVGGYGNLVEIKHPGGIVTRYGHNSAILVTVGQHVDQGSVIAIMGSTGNSTGPHCHYEVRVNGTAVDPLYFLPDLEAEWCKVNNCDQQEGTGNERRALVYALHNFEVLGLTGGILRVNGKIVAFTFGMPINHETFGVHVEKADTTIDGAYAMINYEFANRIPEQYIYINREEDLGIEGLRKAKLSYQPVTILEKYMACLKSHPMDMVKW